MKNLEALRMMSLRQVSDLLGVSLNTLYSWSSQRRIRTYRFGKRVFMAVRDVEAFIQEAEREPLNYPGNRP